MCVKVVWKALLVNCIVIARTHYHQEFMTTLGRSENWPQHLKLSEIYVICNGHCSKFAISGEMNMIPL